MERYENTITPKDRAAEIYVASLKGLIKPLICSLKPLRQIYDSGHRAMFVMLMKPLGCYHEMLFKDDGLIGGEEGASMAEYAILLAVITAALVTILASYTQSIGDIFNYIANVLTGVSGGGS